MAKAKINIEVRRAIRQAQQRIRRAPEFMKNLAKQEGIRLSLRGSPSEIELSYRQAERVNKMKEFTRSGYARWRNELAQDTRLSEKEVDFVLSQIEPREMAFISNSKLRYGSNPQLDFVLETAIEVKNALFQSIEVMRDELDDVFEIF